MAAELLFMSAALQWSANSARAHPAHSRLWLALLLQWLGLAALVSSRLFLSCLVVVFSHSESYQSIFAQWPINSVRSSLVVWRAILTVRLEQDINLVGVSHQRAGGARKVAVARWREESTEIDWA